MQRRAFITGLAFTALASGQVLAAKKKHAPYGGAQYVYFDTPELRGTVIVDTHSRALFYVDQPGIAIRYGVAVGKEGYDWAGVATIGRKLEWPSWTPPRSMIRRKPELARWANGMPGGGENPLGARALYLFANNRDTLFRIHGTNEPWSIGTAASSGCIRMLNEEVSDLYARVRIGTKVIVL